MPYSGCWESTMAGKGAYDCNSPPVPGVDCPRIFVMMGFNYERGVGEMLVRQATRLFAERRVTLAYVWTRGDNEAAVRLYRAAGFEPNRQLVMTWYPGDPSNPR